MLRVMLGVGGGWMGKGVGRGREGCCRENDCKGRGGGAGGGGDGCGEYWRLDWKLIKLTTALHHSTAAPELSFKRTALQAAIT